MLHIQREGFLCSRQSVFEMKSFSEFRNVQKEWKDFIDIEYENCKSLCILHSIRTQILFSFQGAHIPSRLFQYLAEYKRSDKNKEYRIQLKWISA